MCNLLIEYKSLKNIPAVYIFRNIKNGKYYIGETIKLKRRMGEYLFGRKKSNRTIHRAIKKYGINNFSFEFYYFPDFKKENLIELEESMIKSYNSISPNGYNLCDKGTICVGLKMSEKTRLQMIETLSRKIHKYDPISGKYLKSYKSVKDAAKDVGGNTPNITMVANGFRKTAHGFIWNYDKTEFIPPVKAVGITNSKNIYQYSLNGEFIKMYSSLRDAAIAVGGNHNNICNTC